MRKFKHKITKDIAFELNSTDYYSLESDITKIPSKLVENSNDWEEIIEKDYEILSYYAKNISGKGDNYVHPNYIWKQKSPGQWARFYDNQFHTTPYSTEEIINHNGYGIHSVKRLSDGEIFTIGDKVMYENSGDIFIINYFTFYDKKQTKIVAGNSIATDPDNSDWSIINTLIKYKKQPLFKTEDGVDIYENDEYYCTNHQYNLYGPFKGVLKFNVSKTFSTKKGAEAYIIMNKPCLSYKELTERDFIKPCNRNTLLEWIKAKL